MIHNIIKNGRWKKLKSMVFVFDSVVNIFYLLVVNVLGALAYCFLIWRNPLTHYHYLLPGLYVSLRICTVIALSLALFYNKESKSEGEKK